MASPITFVYIPGEFRTIIGLSGKGHKDFIVAWSDFNSGTTFILTVLVSSGIVPATVLTMAHTVK